MLQAADYTVTVIPKNKNSANSRLVEKHGSGGDERERGWQVIEFCRRVMRNSMKRLVLNEAKEGVGKYA